MSKSYSDMNIKEKIAYDCGGTQLIDGCEPCGATLLPWLA